MADAAPVAQSLVTKIVSGYVRKNRLAPADLPGLIATVHQSLGCPAEPPANVVFSQIPVAIQLVRFCSTVF